MEKLARIFKALSDPTRLRIMNLLLERELCVCDLTKVLDISQPNISRHLSCLKNAGLVSSRRVGVFIHYEIANLPPEFKKFLNALDEIFHHHPKLKEDRLRLSSLLKKKLIATGCNPEG